MLGLPEKMRIEIDYEKCGEKGKVDPRECCRCLRVCDPAVFIMHETLGLEQDPIDPQYWRITPVWNSLCTKCMKCVEVCPEGAIRVW